jgi:hypothetical protein
MEDHVPDSLPAGIDPSTLDWRRASGPRPDAAPGGDIEVAITPRAGGGNWVLLRVTADPAGRVLVYDEHEWECFLDGARTGEFGEF